MSQYVTSDLSECDEFRQTIATRPPKVIHGTACLLSLLLIGSVAWAAWTPVSLVVPAKGRIRPYDIPTRIFAPASTENIGRVIFAPFDEGDLVKEGQILIRLDTSRIDNLIAKTNRSIEGCELELNNLLRQRELMQSQTAAAKEKASVELRMAEATFALAQSKRDSEIRCLRADLQAVEEQMRRVQRLQQNHGASKQELEEVETRSLAAREKLAQAQLPIDSAAVKIASQARELVERESAVRTVELESRTVVKQREMDNLVRDLADLQIQRNDATLLATSDGVIMSGRVRVGDMLEAGKPVYELARQSNNCFEAAVSADNVSELIVGLPVRIRLDAYDQMRYGTLQGRVVYLSPDSTPVSAVSSTPVSKSDTPVSQANYTVRVQLNQEQVDQRAAKIPTKLGLTGTAEIVIASESLLSAMLKQLGRTISLD